MGLWKVCAEWKHRAEAAEAREHETAQTRDEVVAAFEKQRRELKDAEARAEQAERERDEARRDKRDMGGIISNTLDALDGYPDDSIVGLAKARMGDLRRAEADNAALLALLQRSGNGDGDGQCLWCGEGEPHRELCPIRDVLDADHPGAALLERIRALERAHVQETSAKAYRHAAEVFGTWHEGECATVLNRMADEANAVKGET